MAWFQGILVAVQELSKAFNKAVEIWDKKVAADIERDRNDRNNQLNEIQHALQSKMTPDEIQDTVKKLAELGVKL